MRAQKLNGRTAKPQPQFQIAPVPFVVVDAATGAAADTVPGTGTVGQGAAIAAATGNAGLVAVSAASAVEGRG